MTRVATFSVLQNPSKMPVFPLFLALGLRCEAPPEWDQSVGPVGTVDCDDPLPGGWPVGSSCRYICPEGKLNVCCCVSLIN